jgi:hypothetical protein
MPCEGSTKKKNAFSKVALELLDDRKSCSHKHRHLKIQQEISGLQDRNGFRRASNKLPVVTITWTCHKTDTQSVQYASPLTATHGLLTILYLAA